MLTIKNPCVLALCILFYGSIGCVVSKANPATSGGWVLNDGNRVFESQIDDDTESIEESEIESLVLKLGSSSYAVRQLASERLWRLGERAKPALEKASERGDSEVAKRSKEILSVLSMGVNSETSAEIAMLVLRFNTSSEVVRKEILRHLVREQRFEIAFDLLERVEDKTQQKNLFANAMNINDTLMKLARSERWDDFKKIISHKITFDHDRVIGVYYHYASGTLGDFVQQLKEEMAEKEADGKVPTQKELYEMIAILRLLERYDEAEEYANKIESATARFPMIYMLWKEQGQWKKIEEQMVDKDAAIRPEDGKIVASYGQLALVHKFTGNEAAYQKVVEKLTKKRDTFKENGDETNVEVTRKKLLAIGMGNLDWELIEDNLNPEKKSNLFSILEFGRRSDKAFDLLEVGDTVEARNVWFGRRVRTIKSINAKIARKKEKREDLDEVNAELARTWDLCFKVIKQLRDRGFDREAVMHYNTLFAAMEESEPVTRRRQILSALVELERTDEVWKMIEMGFVPTEHRQLLYVLFKNQYSSSSYWYGLLTKAYPDTIQRLKAVSGILNSPLGTLPDFDLEQILGQLSPDSAAARNGYFDYRLHEVFLFHGKNETSERYLEMSKQLGYGSAKKQNAMEALKAKDYDTALEYLNGAWKTRSATSEALIVAGIREEQGKTEEALMMRCLGYLFWRSSYRSTTSFTSMVNEEQGEWVDLFINMDICSLQGKVVSNERYRISRADALKELDLKKSAINRQISMYNAMAAFASEFPINLALSQNDYRLTLANACIKDGELDQALKHLMVINQFFPGDASLSEKMIGKLDEAGGQEQSDKLFESISKYYYEMISRYPDSPLYRNDYAWVCACAKRKTDHMLRHSLLATEKRPNFSNYLDTLAEIYHQLGEKEKAIGLAEKCIRLFPSKTHYRDQLKKFRGEENK